MKYYVATMLDRRGRRFEQIVWGESADEARRRLQRLVGGRFVVGEPSEYFGGSPPNVTPFGAKGELK